MLDKAKDETNFIFA